MIKSYDESIKINRNPNWSYIPHHPYRVIFIGGLGSGKTNVLLNIVKYQPQNLTKFIDSSKIHLNQSINCLLTEEKK